MKACYPGTFDPITNGHLDIIQRASKMFDELDVFLMVNPRKLCVFNAEERRQMIEDSLASIGSPQNVKVVIGTGLTVDMARANDCGAIIRGIRAVSDYEYELQQATANMMLGHDIETIFLIAKPQYSFLSSSVVKEIAMYHGDILNLVPVQIIDRVNDKLSKDE
ncbi:MAG: pantetheine-phosphate adenylyltransferase [Solobacterium sp.]|jgi:pantetheine-phosphate adenylyltransferase|nr:pantetheine-phosphate adenylyltransferase [Solobacterium sp.]MCH4204945.1 pantetheine-phosphate adenylyltransferase [Solobacterium sp.]MCH4226337.1 pantetheine-phosphate adenylyltransferase [Solobacterium sp.]MCH4281738.1 pantetheine-phosphate adenylyltransferase [Solobacterium sp.]